ncbi:rRNA-processing protein [Entomophthora muscae]|uniref:rRNA-processing protein n=1 Tax=Entomophthora muscae TaxID=34485 RepID=A0ACC2U3E4_9FUNG|nr:rRNA-processing protein [Entomophthora muscae]
MISAIKWVPRGANKEMPMKYQLDEEEIERIKQLTSDKINAAKMEMSETMGDKAAQEASQKSGDVLSKYNLDDYDNENEDADIFNGKDEPEEDPFAKEDESDNESEAEELRILPTDSLLLAAKTEDEVSQFEVYNYEENENNIYMHHDALLPSFPICLEWLDFKPQSEDVNTKGSFVAIGTFEPEIEIWDLDYIDAVCPSAILGASQSEKRQKKANAEYHTDAIMSLSWNKTHRNLLASSSADFTVKLWDLSQLKCLRSFDHHTDKVQCVQWHPIESTILMTGGFDKKVSVFDSRSLQGASSWNVDSDVECLRWDPFNPNTFVVSTESGLVQAFDVRNATVSLFTIHAHDKAVSTFDINSAIPGCLVTGSVDKTIKIWNINDNKPSMILSRNFDLGQVFSLSFNPDSPYKLGMAGSKGIVKIWDMTSNNAVRSSFQTSGYTFTTPQPTEAQPISIADEGDVESDEEMN